MRSPRLSLALNTGFAAGRWSGPKELFYLAESLGVYKLDIAVNSECDPLRFGRSYLDEWLSQMLSASRPGTPQPAMLSWTIAGASFFGMAGEHDGVRAHLRDQLFKPLIDCACRLGSGLTLPFNAIPNSALQQPQLYRRTVSRLTDELAELSHYGSERLPRPLAVAPAAAPHLLPWRRRESERLARAAEGRIGVSLECAQIGPQRHFLRPARDTLLAAIEAERRGRPSPALWLGPVAAEAELRAAGEEPEREAEEMAYRIEQIQEGYPYLFAEEEDAQPEAWLHTLAPRLQALTVAGGTGQSGGSGGAERLRALLAAYRRGLDEHAAASQAAESAVEPPDELLVTLSYRPESAMSGQELLRRIAADVTMLRSVIAEDDCRLDEIV